MARTGWVDVDLDGLAKTLARRGKGWILRELAQNAFDEDVTRVEITFEPVAGRPLCLLRISDNSSTGFLRLEESWTLFGSSRKVTDPTKAGRFLAGEKFVLAFCEQAKIESTTGTVMFDSKHGRRVYPKKTRPIGTCVSALLRMQRTEIAELQDAAREIFPPVGVTVVVDGTILPHPVPVADFCVLLETEVADAGGILRKKWRDTDVRLYDTNGEPAKLFELGLPIVETGDRWHVDVRQKVPLTLERDNVPPAYLQDVRVAVLNAMHDVLTPTDVTETWVREAVGDTDAVPEAIQSVTTKRFGDKVVAYDPSDPEANKMATAAGYTVVHGGSLSSDEWDNVKRVGAILPAGKVTPSPKPFSADGKPLRIIPRNEWKPRWVLLEQYARAVARETIGRDIVVTLANDPTWGHDAAYGPTGVLYLNLGSLGHRWFDAGPVPDVNALLIHEFAHEWVSDHLSREFYRALCKVGAKFVDAVAAYPSLVLAYMPGRTPPE